MLIDYKFCSYNCFKMCKYFLIYLKNTAYSCLNSVGFNFVMDKQNDKVKFGHLLTKQYNLQKPIN